MLCLLTSNPNTFNAHMINTLNIGQWVGGYFKTYRHARDDPNEIVLGGLYAGNSLNGTPGALCVTAEAGTCRIWRGRPEPI